jgi:hypothetical protein
MMTHKRLEGTVEYNNVDFAEIQTIGTEGPEKGDFLWIPSKLASPTPRTPLSLERRLPVGIWLEIWTTMTGAGRGVEWRHVPNPLLAVSQKW